MTAPTDSKPFPWIGLLTLGALTFTSVTSEFLPTGLLPEIASELKVSESQVGLLVTLFAGTVVLTAAPLTALTRRFSRKSLVITVLLIFVVGNVLAAVAPTYAVLAVARVIGGLAHGLFWAVVGAYSAHLVPKHQIGRAVAITSGGTTLALVLGVPVGTALGHAFGWRLAFGVIACGLLLLVVLAIRLIPSVQHIEELATGEIPLPLRKDRSVPGVVIVCIVVILVNIGHNLFSTYIAPFLIGPVGVGSSGVAPALFLYGGVGVIGLLVAGIVADRFPRAGFAVTVVVIAASVTVIGLAPSVPWIFYPAFIVWGIAFGAAPAMLHARMLHTASARVRDIAAAYLTTSFNIGIGGGALIGGILLDRISITSLPFADAAIAIVGVAVALLGDAWLRRRLHAPRG